MKFLRNFMNIHVRLAHPHDVSIIAGFNEEIAKETEGIELHHARLRTGVETLLLDSSKGLYYVAEVENKIVGQVMITYEWSDWRNAIFWWIQSVYVHPDYRNQGVFRMLYRHIESLARTQGNVCGLRLYVEKENERAQRTYEVLGMKHSHYAMMEVDFPMHNSARVS
jgi:GNAT superfamily N-acetyltransferase